MEHGVQALLLGVEGAGAQDSLVHLLRAGGVLDHGAFGGQVALQDSDGALCADGFVVRADDVFASDAVRIALAGQDVRIPAVEILQPAVALLIEAAFLQGIQVLAERLAGDGHDIQVEDLPDLLHDRRDTATLLRDGG